MGNKTEQPKILQELDRLTNEQIVVAATNRMEIVKGELVCYA